MVSLFKDKTSFVNMHEITTQNQEIIIKIAKKNQEVLSEINEQLASINSRIDKIEKKLGIIK